MDEVTRKLQREAERIAARHPLPEFYARFQAPAALARKLFFRHPTLSLLRRDLQPFLHDELGHGLYHSTRVSIDTATLVYVELQYQGKVARDRVERLMVLGIAAGMLHDIRRNEGEHARLGAEEAARVLRRYPLGCREIQCVCAAIRNHEAFTTPTTGGPEWFELVSDCLYDADKFRWGPDTFVHTLWHMVSQQGLSPRDLIARFPWGMTGLARISETFRTGTGRQYGPGIIDTGAEIGKEIYQYLRRHYQGDSSGQ